ncbi:MULTISPECIES: DUF4194 domain-containing protein [unclassified Treponema]|uniref:DUF4194 domain-containing protein n=1 Tax=unclassified Treponema TaxID=2638727 RepID=UPI0020A4763D|nr:MULTISPECIES: DUF4194 domain-containing protein [unclassified Treponema]UTC67305.1 DUF4194 domain-containing protein [Treponema sp. OMZ 789]UTC70033.1 DUF4194 domain-containing protein [Treponema sp. OMZ 790]UTC72749.1 DUF4194 domain-containing protein [Treponema sp. OMZ 791]
MTAVWAAPCIKLLQGPLYENEGDSDSWRLLIQYQGEITSFFDQIGISVFIEPAEGYAFLEQKEDEEGAPESVRLIRRYPLSFEMSILCVLLREALEQFDISQNDSSILVLPESEIRSMLSVYFKEKTDQTKLYNELTKYLNQAVDLGFLKELHQDQNGRIGDDLIDRKFEVRRILRAKITTEFLSEFKKRLENYNREEK